MNFLVAFFTSGVKPHTCPACGKSFARADALKRHLKSTDPSKTTACSQKVRVTRIAQSVGISAANQFSIPAQFPTNSLMHGGDDGTQPVGLGGIGQFHLTVPSQ
jgi:hypothetical protein